MANSSCPWWQNKIAYQIYPKSFLDGNGDGIGDLPGVLSKLDYLKDLGVDILWLSPVYPSPMVDQGYDISDYYGVDPRFGTMEDLDALIRELKRRGMYLVMDLVVSHCSDRHRWFQEAVRDPAGKYGQYFYLKPGRNGGPPNNWRAEFGGPEGYFSTLFDFAHFLADHRGAFWYQHKPFDFRSWRDAIFRSQENASVFLANVLENHDRPRSPGIFLPEGDEGYESITAMAALSVLLRGIPFLYQGQEIGMRNGDFRTVEDFEDLNTRDQYQAARAAGLTEAEAVAVCRRHSRDNARTPMQWTGGEHAGFTSGTPWFPVNPNYRELNVEADAASARSVRGWYQRLLALRKDPEWEDALVRGGFRPAFREEPEIFAYWRTGEESGKRVLVLCHYGRGTAFVPFAEPFRVLLNNYEGLESREGRLWLDTYQVVVLACGAGEQEEV